MAIPRKLFPRPGEVTSENLRISAEVLFRRMEEQKARATEMTKSVHKMRDRAAQMRKLPRFSWPQF